MTRTDFESKLRALLDAHAGRKDNRDCFECTSCEGCIRSTFCRGSKALVGCHYCVDSERCHESTHCRASRELTSCTHCNSCERCIGCSYLVRSIDCTNCNYCFGCVGLSNKDFHILNEPYDRSTYFALTSQLTRELRLG